MRHCILILTACIFCPGLGNVAHGNAEASANTSLEKDTSANTLQVGAWSRMEKAAKTFHLNFFMLNVRPFIRLYHQVTDKLYPHDHGAQVPQEAGHMLKIVTTKPTDVEPASDGTTTDEEQIDIIATVSMVGIVGVCTGIIYYNLKARFWPRLYDQERARNKLHELTLGWQTKPSPTRFPYDFDETWTWPRTCCFSWWPCGCACARWADTIRIAGLGGYWTSFFSLFVLYMVYLVCPLWFTAVPLFLVMSVQRSRIRMFFASEGGNLCDPCAVMFCWGYQITQEAMCVEEAFSSRHPGVVSNHESSEVVPFAQERMSDP